MARSACLLSLAGWLGSRGLAGAVPTVEVVVAHHTENLSWIQEYESPSVEFTVYSKSKPTPVGAVVLPNVGRESHTYLYHIVRHYNRIADWTVFTQGVRPSWGYHGGGEVSGHLSDNVQFADYLRPFPNGSDSYFVLNAASEFPTARHTNRVGFMIKNLKDPAMGKTMCPPREAEGWTQWWADAGHPHLWAKKEDITMLQFYHRFIAEDDYSDEPLTLTFAQGARFAVSRQRIHSRPQKYYAELLRQLSSSIMPQEGYWMEAAWYDVFHPEALQSKSVPCALPPKPSSEGILSIPMMQEDMVQRAIQAGLLEDPNDSGSKKRQMSASYAYAYTSPVTSAPTGTPQVTDTETTTATTTATLTTTTTELPVKVKLMATLMGVDFLSLSANAKVALAGAQNEAVNQSFIDGGMSEADAAALTYTTTLFAGSVRFETEVTFPSGSQEPARSTVNNLASALKTNLMTKVQTITSSLGSAVTGTLSVARIMAETVLPPPPAGETTTAPTCTWTLLHAGSCFPGGVTEEEPIWLGGWTTGTLEAAQDACCANEYCGGFHMDAEGTSRYALLDTTGAADTSPGAGQTCWKKSTGTDLVTTTGELEPPSWAAPRALGLLPPLAAVAIAFFGAMVPLHSV